VEMHYLMNHLLSRYSVRDIKVAEPEIDELIRAIYNGEVV